MHGVPKHGDVEVAGQVAGELVGQHLQRLYSDPRNPPLITMKAARAAVAYGRSKPSPVAGASLYDMLEERKRLEQRKRVIDAKPDPAA